MRIFTGPRQTHLVRLILAIALVYSPVNCIAAVIAYEFKGTVSVANSPPYGITIDPFAAVSGGFSYDTDVVPVISGNVATYRGQIPNGFWATIGTAQVSASDYMVQVSNDFAQGKKSPLDLFVVQFSNTQSPMPTVPLNVNGQQQSIGLFSLTFSAPTSLFADTKLPPSLNLSDFSSKSGFFSDTPTGGIDVIFSISDLLPVPEPAAVLLGSWGLVILAGTCAAKRIRK